MSKPRKPYECINSQGGLRARAWWVLRRETEADIAGILAAVARRDETGAVTNLHNYFRALVKAGFLAVEKVDGKNHYTLINNTGPCAPIWRRSRGQVYDQNTQAVIDIAGGENA